MKNPIVTLAVLALLATPALAEITANQQRVGGSQNLNIIRLDGNTLFGSAEDVLTPGGRKALDKVIEENPTIVMRRIKVTGHTDFMGNDEYNRKLSLRRAEAVKKYLSSRNGNFRIDVDGLGEKEPLVTCSEKLPRAKLIGCLQPNRRVEIEILQEY